VELCSEVKRVVQVMISDQRGRVELGPSTYVVHDAIFSDPIKAAKQVDQLQYQSTYTSECGAPANRVREWRR